MRSAIFVLSCAAILGACTPNPPVTTVTDADAKRFGTNPGMGALYVVRTNDEMSAYGLDLGLDTRSIATLGQNTYTRVDLASGPHTLTCRGARAPLVVQIMSGQPTFIDAALMQGRCVMAPLDQASGRARVLGSQLMPPRS
ncbi:hypothetical protein FHP25_09695 [Vineibacter terrae]|uniref:DUF2846 domain-containing protein n=1 Tax=Vineibacter terrae TaxID=2586908 RepID=A0A5C8PRP7_9HYPH|nr:hypothetical protein [Vineibacter terrae]TXL77685.1 hypothetical protein FHP25_09695 [Vineibacter terrae]